MKKRRRSGEPTGYKLSTIRNRSGENNKTGFDSAIFEDITERQKKTEHIQYLSGLVEFPEDAIVSKSLDGIIISWNKGGEKMFGYTAAQAIGQHISIIIPAEYINEEKMIIDKIRNNETNIYYETVGINKDGNHFYVSLTVSPLKDTNGDIIGITKIARDISARKLAETQLQASLIQTSAYKHALDESSIVAVTNSKGIIVHANDNFCNISKYTREELIGQDHRIVNSGHHPKEYIYILWNTISKGGIWKGELKNKAKDGSIYWVDTTIVPSLDENGKLYQYIAIRADITKRKIAEEELTIAFKELAFQNGEKEKRAAELTIANKALAYQNEEKEKRASELIIALKELAFQNGEKEKRAAELMVINQELASQNKEIDKKASDLVISNAGLSSAKKQLKEANMELEAFSYSVSHDLRAPLRAISGFATMLKTKFSLKLDQEANRIINVVVDNATMMSQLIDDLLSFSKMARAEAINARVDMSSLAQKCVAELSLIENQSKYSIHIGTLPLCKGDAGMLKQVWYNLIGNAIKYSSKKDAPAIEIGTTDDPNNNVYYVKDNGAGFDMKYAHKLFGVFQRLHRNSEFEGTGLGLALVNRIVSKHGGRIWASATLNTGAIFYFSIPK